MEQNHDKLNNIILQAPVAMCLFSGPTYLVEIANPHMLAFWGKTANQVMGRPVFEVVPEAGQQGFKEILDYVYLNGKRFTTIEMPASLQHHNTVHNYYFDFVCEPLFEAGAVTGISAVVIDVTEKVEARQKIKDAADRLQLVIEGSQQGIWDLNLEDNTLVHSPRMAVIFGHQPSVQLSHAEFRAQINAGDRQAIVEPAFARALQVGRYDYQARITRPDNTVCWIETHGKVVFDEAGKPLRMLGTVMDVTAQKAAEENFTRLAAIVESSDDAIISKRLDGIVVSWNDSARRIFGYTASEMIGQPILKLIPPDRLDEETEIIKRLKKGERVEHFETKRLTKDKQLIDISLTISPIKDSQGIIVGASKIARDVTVQKAAERMIAENEERLKIVLEASGLGTWELNLQTYELTYSDRYLEIMGYAADTRPAYHELVKRLYAADLPARENAFKVAFETGVLHYQMRIIWPDESLHWIEAKGKVFYDEAGKPAKMIGTIQDITRDMFYKQRIEESEKRFKTVADSAPVLIWMAGTDKLCNYFNTAWLQFTGRRLEQELGNGWAEGVHPHDMKRCLEIYATMFDRHEEFYMEYRLKRYDGEYRWVSDRGIPRFTPEGNFEGYIGGCMDIHDRILFEEKLRESETRFRIVADTAPVMIWMTNLDRDAIFLNKCWSDFTGISVQDGLGNGWVAAVHPDDLNTTSAAFKQAYIHRNVYSKELRIKRKDGKYRWVQDHAVPRYDSEGAFLGFIGTSVDIHEQRDAKKELENRVEERTADLLDANEQLIKTNEELEQFAYVSSHDLQEPLRKIQTFSEMLTTSMEVNAQSARYLEKINSAARRMSNLINDLLNYSRLSKTDERFMRTDLNEVLQNVKNDFEILIEQKNAVIESDVLPVIQAIPVQINQLFYNLVSNALKFSEQQPVIRIKAKVLSSPTQLPGLMADHKYLHLTFSDNGIGFSPAHAEQIFVIFQRLNDRSNYSGTGIGLAICKKIVENHHGHITASAQPGAGATFDIYLPV